MNLLFAVQVFAKRVPQRSLLISIMKNALLSVWKSLAAVLSSSFVTWEKVDGFLASSGSFLERFLLDFGWGSVVLYRFLNPSLIQTMKSRLMIPFYVCF